MATVTKPPALDETLQAVNDTLGEIRDALEGGGGGEYIPKVAEATAGNVPILKADGTLEDSGGTIPSKTSDLTNDSNFVADAAYVHTDNNYTSAEKVSVGQITGIKNDLSQLSDEVDEVKSIYPSEHSTSTTYSYGNLAFHNGELYEYTNSTASSGAWNPNYWTKVTLGNMAFLKYTVVSTF